MSSLAWVRTWLCLLVYGRWWQRWLQQADNTFLTSLGTPSPSKVPQRHGCSPLRTGQVRWKNHPDASSLLLKNLSKTLGPRKDALHKHVNGHPSVLKLTVKAGSVGAPSGYGWQYHLSQSARESGDEVFPELEFAWDSKLQYIRLDCFPLRGLTHHQRAYCENRAYKTPQGPFFLALPLTNKIKC